MLEATRRSDHSSRSRIAPGLKQPTRGSELRSCERNMRAGPALPSYLALLHAGFSVPRMLPFGRWALTPPFHPCQMRSTEEGKLPVFPKACRRGASITGGLFSVALSVAVEDPEKLPVAASKDPRDSPLALPGALPCRGRLLRAHHSRSPDFPPAHPSVAFRRPQGKPAITRLTRQSHYNPVGPVLSLEAKLGANRPRVSAVENTGTRRRPPQPTNRWRAR